MPRRRSHQYTTPSPAPPPSILDAAKAAYQRLPASSKNRAKAVLCALKAVEDAPPDQRIADADDLYTGSYDFGGSPSVPEAFLDLYSYRMALRGTPLPQGFVDTAFSPECLTNIAKTGSGPAQLSFVTTKYLGMEPTSREGTMAIDEPDAFLVDFVYNVVRLELRTPAQIKEFLAQELLPTVRGYLLDEAGVERLIEEGEHEAFDEAALNQTRQALQDVTSAAELILRVHD